MLDEAARPGPSGEGQVEGPTEEGGGQGGGSGSYGDPPVVLLHTDRDMPDAPQFIPKGNMGTQGAFGMMAVKA